MGLMTGRKGLVFGLANERSIAWGIAKRLHEEGAELGFSYLNEAFEKRVRPLADSLGSSLVFGCDVTKDADIEAAFARVKEAWGKIDFVVHSVAFAGKDELKNPFWQTSRDGFRVALDTSAYSLVAVTRASLPLMTSGGAVITLTYLGATRAMVNYNVMGVAKAALEASVRYLAAELGEKGVRVNAISAGPVRTLSASGVSGFTDLWSSMESKAPLRRAITLEEVGNAAVYLLSDMSSGVTGEIHFVDTGYNIVGA